MISVQFLFSQRIYFQWPCVILLSLCFVFFLLWGLSRQQSAKRLLPSLRHTLRAARDMTYVTDLFFTARRLPATCHESAAWPVFFHCFSFYSSVLTPTPLPSSFSLVHGLFTS